MASSSTTTSASTKSVFAVDAHHHFLDTRRKDDGGGNGDDFQAFVASLLPNEVYLPADYHRDVVEPLRRERGVALIQSVHVECMPDSGPQEVAWIDSLVSSETTAGSTCTVRAIVGSCDLTSPAVDDDLRRLVEASTRHRMVRGVRWILDCASSESFEPHTASHVAITRHRKGQLDYLRAGDNSDAVADFERGFARLAEHQLSFDLQCAPVQLLAAAELCRRHPGVPVVIDHLGKPRTILGPDIVTATTTDDDGHESTVNPNLVPDASELRVWRTGLQAMAAIPHVYVKLSMLGYSLPGWIRTPERRAVLQDLVREVLDLFTPRRCMMAWNWWKNGAVSDADFLSDVGPTAVEYYDFIQQCLEPYTEEEREWVRYRTAQTFYRMSTKSTNE